MTRPLPNRLMGAFVLLAFCGAGIPLVGPAEAGVPVGDVPRAFRSGWVSPVGLDRSARALDTALDTARGREEGIPLSGTAGAPIPVPGPLSQQLGDDLSAPSTSPSYNRSAILTSLLLPGLAQYRMGEKERGLAFLTLEAAFWTSFAAFRIQGANREDSYVEMAELFAGISPDAPTDEDFYKALSNWPSSDLYNEIVVRRLARNVAGDDIEGREAYYEENRIQGNETWAWSSETARTAFRTKRTEAQRSFKRSRNMVGLAVANRVVAMIDAVLLSNRLHGSGYGLEVTQSRDGSDLVARVGLRKRLP